MFFHRLGWELGLWSWEWGCFVFLMFTDNLQLTGRPITCSKVVLALFYPWLGKYIHVHLKISLLQAILSKKISLMLWSSCIEGKTCKSITKCILVFLTSFPRYHFLRYFKHPFLNCTSVEFFFFLNETSAIAENFFPEKPAIFCSILKLLISFKGSV